MPFLGDEPRRGDLKSVGHLVRTFPIRERVEVRNRRLPWGPLLLQSSPSLLVSLPRHRTACHRSLGPARPAGLNPSLEALVDRVDHALVGLEGAQRLDHVDHRLGRRGVRLLQEALAHGRVPGRAGAPPVKRPPSTLVGFESAATASVPTTVAAGLHRPVVRDRGLRVRADDDRLAVRAEHRVADGRDELAARVDAELAVARVADAVRVATAKKPSPSSATSSGSSVMRSAPCVRSTRRPASSTPRPTSPSGAPLRRLSSRMSPKACWRRDGALVARGGGVREVVRDPILPGELGEHSRGHDVETAIHRTITGTTRCAGSRPPGHPS